ncbi:MAG: hypothetical protein QW104_03875, partial [Nitrososphaerota archaeon]
LAESMLIDELPRRLKALSEKYEWIEPEGLEFFYQRMSYLTEEIEIVSRAIEKKILSSEQLKKCIKAAKFNCDVQWAILDAIYMKYIVTSQ